MGTENYAEFDYPISQLSAFILSIDTFIISLKSGKVIHFIPKDTNDFKEWLMKHKIRDITIDNGIPKNLQR